MSDLSAPGSQHRSLTCTVTAWWYGHSRQRRRTMRLWGGLVGGFIAVTILATALRTLA